MVSQQELRQRGRGIGALARAREQVRLQQQQQEAIARINRKLQEQARKETQEARTKAEEERAFQFGITEKATRRRPKRFTVVKEFSPAEFGGVEATRKAAERFAEEFGKDPAVRSEIKGIRRKPVEPEARTLGGDIILGPPDPKADIGKRLQRRRERIEKEIRGQVRKVPIPLGAARPSTQQVKFEDLPKDVQEQLKKRALITPAVGSALGVKITVRPPREPSRVSVGREFRTTVSVTGPELQEAKIVIAISGKPLKSQEALLRRDESRIDRGDIRVGVGSVATILDIPKTKFEKRIKRTKQLEQAQARFLKRIKFEKGIRRIQKTFQTLVPGKGIPSRVIEGGLVGIAGAPFFAVSVAGAIPTTTAKILATGEAIIRPSIRPQVFPELKRVGKETIIGLATPETAGFLLTTPLIGTIPKLKAKVATKAVKGKVVTPKVKETLPSTLIRVKELKGVEVRGRTLVEGFRREAKLETRPILSKSELIDVRQLEKPDLIFATIKGERVRKIRTTLGKEGETRPVPTIQAKVPETIEGKFFLTPEQLKKLQVPITEKIGVAEKFIPLRKEVTGKARISLQAIELKKGVPAVIKRGRFRRRTRAEEAQRQRQIGQQLKLERDVFIQVLEERPGKIIAREIRRTPRGKIIKRTIEREVPEVFIKDPFGFGKKKFERQAQQITRGVSKVPTTEAGGLVQLLKPPKLKVKQKAKQVSKLKAEQKAKGKTLQELLGRQKLKKRTGIFVIEEVVSRQRAATAVLLRPKLAPISAQRVLISQQALVQQQAPVQGVAVSAAQLQGQQVLVSLGVLSLQAQSLAASQLAGQQVSVAQQQAVLQQQVAQQAVQSFLEPVTEKITRVQKDIPRLLLKPGRIKDEITEAGDLITEKAPSFDVQVRRGEKRGDKFVTVKKRLPENKALKLLTGILDTHIEASGRLKPSKKKAKVTDDLLAPRLFKFRKPRKGSRLPSNTIIEKKQHRLDTQGEIDQISFFKRKQALKKRIAALTGNPGTNNGLSPDIPFKTELNLELPKTTKVQAKILEVVKKEGAAVTGSFAQQTFVKDSRKFTDIDIVTTKVKILARKIKKALGSKVKIKEVEIESPQGKFKISRVFSTKTGKQIADIDPLRFAEEGQISKFGTQKIQGLNIVSVRARLQAKVLQLKRGKTKRGKIARDIMQLTASRLKPGKNLFSKSSNFFSEGGIL